MRAGALRASTTRLVASDGSDRRRSSRTSRSRSSSRAGRPPWKPCSTATGRGDVSSVVSGVDVARLAAKARARTGRSAPAMEQWHRVELPAGVDAAAAARELLALRRGELRLPGAGRRAAAADHHDAGRSPRCRATCGRRRVGTDDDFSLQDPRTRGAGVRIADLEYYWTAEHEDLQLDPVAADLGGDRLPAVPQLRRRARHRGLRRDGRQGQRLRRHRRRAGRLDARHLTDPRPAATGSPQYIPSAALVYVAPVPLARRRRAARAADRRPQRRHALRAAGVEPGQLRRDQDALRPRASSSSRPAATAARISTPRRCWAASTARCATPARSSSAPATPPPAPR